MTAAPEPEATRTGRPRDPACDLAIVEATLELFAEHGYAGLSIEGVASRAGVGKATIYRRFDDKADLVIAAVRHGVEVEDRLPDTGDLRADLTTMMAPLTRRLRGDDRKLLTTFLAERVRNPDLAAAFERSVIGAKRGHVRALLRAAVERGELSEDADVDLIAEAIPAVIWHYALYDLTMPRDLLDRILDLVLPRA